jgi:histidine triad (HIT) family protein
VHARNLFHVSGAMWDAWATFDARAQTWVIPERHVDSMAGVEGLTPEERADMLVFISAVAREHGLEPTGYRVTTNHGPDALQSVHHLHWHVMGGTRLSDSM